MLRGPTTQRWLLKVVRANRPAAGAALSSAPVDASTPRPTALGPPHPHTTHPNNRPGGRVVAGGRRPARPALPCRRCSADHQVHPVGRGLRRIVDGTECGARVPFPHPCKGCDTALTSRSTCHNLLAAQWRGRCRRPPCYVRRAGTPPRHDDRPAHGGGAAAAVAGRWSVGPSPAGPAPTRALRRPAGGVQALLRRLHIAHTPSA